MKSACFLAFIASYCVVIPVVSYAEGKPLVDILSAATAQPSNDGTPTSEDTAPPLRVTPDKSEIIKLEADAASVIVGNPDHISVLAESPRLLVVVPKATGASYFTVLDAKGAVIMQRHVIVGSPKDNYVRVKKTCQTSSVDNKTQGDCKLTSVYYCPDMCHNIGEEQGGANASDSAEAQSGTSSADTAKEDPASKPVYEEPAETDRGTEE